MFERGDLVKAKEEWTATFDNRYDLGVVLAVEKDFYQHNFSFLLALVALHLKQRLMSQDYPYRMSPNY